MKRKNVPTSYHKPMPPITLSMNNYMLTKAEIRKSKEYSDEERDRIILKDRESTDEVL